MSDADINAWIYQHEVNDETKQIMIKCISLFRHAIPIDIIKKSTAQIQTDTHEFAVLISYATAVITYLTVYVDELPTSVLTNQERKFISDNSKAAIKSLMILVMAYDATIPVKETELIINQISQIAAKNFELKSRSLWTRWFNCCYSSPIKDESIYYNEEGFKQVNIEFA